MGRIKHCFALTLLLWSCTDLEGCNSITIQPKYWEFKGHGIGYEVSFKGVAPDLEKYIKTHSREELKEPILILNGFGVGSFHQHRLIPLLLEAEEQSRLVYGIDYLGQGRSWPKGCQDGNSESEKGLIYSAET